jgi:hypothetical protein
MKENFFPKATIVGNLLRLNSEAIETMELDVEGSKVIILEITEVEKKRIPKEILIVKTNGSLCDDIENIKDVFPPERIRKVTVETYPDDSILGFVDIDNNVVDSIKGIFGDKDEFKLLVCNTDSPLGKEFKEQFDIQNSFYRFAYINDKRSSVGKDKNVKEKVEERISIN